jgi:iron complex transport system substrate-binding protein
MPRIATMIASATEIVCALGSERDLVARSHECDYPPGIAKLPVCTAPKFDVHGNSLAIDQRVTSLLELASSIYHVDAAMLQQLRPEVIVTQAQCDVCAVSEKDVAAAVGSWTANTPTIVTLSPNNLADVWQTIKEVARVLNVPERGEMVVRGLQERVDAIARTAETIEQRPTVACLEWLDPLMAAGNWVPELAELAGGVNLIGQAGKHSPWMNWDELRQRDPDIIVALPCGFDLAKTTSEILPLRDRAGWHDLRAVRGSRVFVTDGNQFFNRPGPRLVESLEILAEIFYPELFRFGHEGIGWARFDASA